MTIDRIRSAEPLLAEEVFSVYAACMYRPDRERYERAVRGLLREGGAAFLCTEGGRTAGVLFLSLLPDGSGEIRGIAVREGLRFRGIGRSLLRVAAGCLTGQMIAETDDDAVGFYRAADFEAVRKLVSFPRGEAVRYSCSLRLRSGREE